MGHAAADRDHPPHHDVGADDTAGDAREHPGDERVPEELKPEHL
ncbi:hypothetical protein [Methanoculleus bourgensis]